MKLQYLEGLKAIGTSEATKFVLPVELMEMVKEWLTKRGSGE